MIKSDVLDIISLYIGKILHKLIFLNVSVQYFICFHVKCVTFREPVLGLLPPDFVYVYINRIETNFPVCRLYHYIQEILRQVVLGIKESTAYL